MNWKSAYNCSIVQIKTYIALVAVFGDRASLVGPALFFFFFRNFTLLLL